MHALRNEVLFPVSENLSWICRRANRTSFKNTSLLSISIRGKRCKLLRKTLCSVMFPTTTSIDWWHSLPIIYGRMRVASSSSARPAEAFGGWWYNYSQRTNMLLVVVWYKWINIRDTGDGRASRRALPRADLCERACDARGAAYWERSHHTVTCSLYTELGVHTNWVSEDMSSCGNAAFHFFTLDGRVTTE